MILYRVKSARDWLLGQIGRRPHWLVLTGVIMFLLAVLGGTGQVLHLLNERELEARQHQLRVTVTGLDEMLSAEIKRLQLLQNYAEHALQAESLAGQAATDPAVQNALATSTNSSWQIPAEIGAAPVIGLSADELHSLIGFSRRDADLGTDLYVARAVTRVMCELVQSEDLEIHAIYLSSNGFYVFCPEVANYSPQQFMQRMQGMPYYREVLPDRNPERKIHWTSLYRQFQRDNLLISLSAPVYLGNEFRGAAVININQSVLGEFLARTAEPGQLRVLLDQQGELLAISNQQLEPGQKWPAGLPDEGKKIADYRQMVSQSSGRLSQNGNYLLFQRLKNVDWTLVDFVPASALRAGIASRLSTTFIGIALALVLLMWLIFAVITRLFRLLQQRGEELQALAEQDPLTGLANRRYFSERFKLERERRLRDQTPLALLMLDIDFFKKVNDRWGHANGDLVLKTLAQVCRATLRAVDLPARFGGEEFAVMLPNTSLTEATAIAERLRLVLAATICKATGIEGLASGTPPLIQFTVSIGVAEATADHCDGLAELAEIADRRLYLAKAGGRNQVVSHDSAPAATLDTSPQLGGADFKG